MRTIARRVAVGCALCGERLDWRDVNVLEEMDRAVELGVMTPPSLAIDGKLVFPVRYDPDTLHDEFGATFRLVKHHTELHQTPAGSMQQFRH